MPWRDAPGRAAGDRGSVLPLAALALFVIIGLALLLGRLGGLAIDEARARTAADAAALAGAAEGEAAAKALARANGGTLEEFRTEGTDAVVAVRVGRAVVRARARRTARPGTPVVCRFPVSITYTLQLCPPSSGR